MYSGGSQKIIGWLTQGSQYDNAFLIIITTLISFHFIWERYLFPSDEIPNEFWYQVPQASSGQADARKNELKSRSIARKFEENQLDLVVFWGSQSGRAELLARVLARNLQTRFGFKTLAADLDDYDHKHLVELKKQQLCAFILSTYGDGDPPDNTNGFWNALNLLQSNNTRLESLRYMIFGLGNSNYRQYNRVAEYVDSVFQILGAERLGQVGQGDDANGETEIDFLSWRRTLEKELKLLLHLTEQSCGYQPVFQITEVPSIAPDKVSLGEPHFLLRVPQRVSSAIAPSVLAVSRARKLWETDARLCIHVDVDVGDTRLVKYKTGDYLTIWPFNPDHEVEQLVSILGFSEKRHIPISIGSIDGSAGQKLFFPTLTTPDALFRYYLEISGRLSLETIAALIEFAPSDRAINELQRLTSDGSIFRSEILEPHLTLAELLRKTDSSSTWRIPMSFILEKFKPMKPRSYSICSSAAVQPKMISMVAVINKSPNIKDDPNAIPKGCYGLATSYIHALETRMNAQDQEASSCRAPSTFALSGPRGILTGGKIFGRVSQSKFKLPARVSAPVIMIGAGTGVAPFRAFVQERIRRKAFDQVVGRTLLFMGFRHPEVDYIYKQDWDNVKDVLGEDTFKYWTAFSREHESKKVYVQDRLTENAEEVLSLLQEDVSCRVYICGSADMARDVVATFAKMKMDYAGSTEEQAMSWIKQLRQSKQLLEDVWS